MPNNFTGKKIYRLKIDGFSKWVVEKCLPVSWCLMWDQILFKGFKFVRKPSQNMILMDFSSQYGYLCSVDGSIFLLNNNIWSFLFRPFCNILSYSEESSSMLLCDRDKFTIVFLARSSDTSLVHTLTSPNYSESNFLYSDKNFVLSSIDSNGFLRNAFA